MSASVHAMVFLLLIALPLGGQGRPAYWHWWESKVDGARFCHQTSPGDGWRYSSGPYRDARCRIPAYPR